MEPQRPRPEGIVVKKRHILMGGIVVILLLAVAVGLGINWNNWFGQGNPAQPRTMDIDPGASDWTQSSPPDQGGASGKGIAIPGYPSISLPAGTKEVQVTLLNPEGNPCYFTFELVLKETGESLYQSKLVPPGKAVTELTLLRGLAAGEYEAIIKITTTSLSDGQTPMNGADVETKLIVE